MQCRLLILVLSLFIYNILNRQRPARIIMYIETHVFKITAHHAGLLDLRPPTI